MRGKLYGAMLSVKKKLDSVRTYSWNSATYKKEALAKAALERAKQEARKHRYLMICNDIGEYAEPHEESLTIFEGWKIVSNTSA